MMDLLAPDHLRFTCEILFDEIHLYRVEEGGMNLSELGASLIELKAQLWESHGVCLDENDDDEEEELDYDESDPITDLVIHVSWAPSPELQLDGSPFVRLLHRVFPNLTRLVYFLCHIDERDEQGDSMDLLVALLAHNKDPTPTTQLSSLEISFTRWQPQEFHCSLDKLAAITVPHLQELKLIGQSITRLSSSCLTGLGHFIQNNHTSLQTVEFFGICNPNQFAWEPVIGALRGMTGLQKVAVLHDEEDHPEKHYPIHDPSAMARMQYWPNFLPRIQQTKANHLGGGDPSKATPEQWIQALLSVRDRVDCLYYFLSTYPMESSVAAKAILERGL
ncbi:expressed unknown protein [Seminavis robusta]|uniref:Uncharacterized protein n=1 Tax=Seminavis robusta TaxID=568900 RepID=A0A9N8DVC2_9STRA|nr:expressed unknown protein [Seminavis robusta]|eukprot:Sro379_g130400.1 n/a (334) ;mRNA; r:16180-17181